MATMHMAMPSPFLAGWDGNDQQWQEERWIDQHGNVPQRWSQYQWDQQQAQLQQSYRPIQANHPQQQYHAGQPSYDQVQSYNNQLPHIASQYHDGQHDQNTQLYFNGQQYNDNQQYSNGQQYQKGHIASHPSHAIYTNPEHLGGGFIPVDAYPLHLGQEGYAPEFNVGAAENSSHNVAFASGVAAGVQEAEARFLVVREQIMDQGMRAGWDSCEKAAREHLERLLNELLSQALDKALQHGWEAGRRQLAAERQAISPATSCKPEAAAVPLGNTDTLIGHSLQEHNQAIVALENRATTAEAMSIANQAELPTAVRHNKQLEAENVRKQAKIASLEARVAVLDATSTDQLSELERLGNNPDANATQMIAKRDGRPDQQIREITELRTEVRLRKAADAKREAVTKDLRAQLEIAEHGRKAAVTKALGLQKEQQDLLDRLKAGTDGAAAQAVRDQGIIDKLKQEKEVAGRAAQYGQKRITSVGQLLEDSQRAAKEAEATAQNGRTQLLTARAQARYFRALNQQSEKDNRRLRQMLQAAEDAVSGMKHEQEEVAAQLRVSETQSQAKVDKADGCLKAMQKERDEALVKA